MNYISIDDVLEIHKQLIDEFGGSHGIRDLGRIESVVASQSQEVFGEQVYESVYDKAGAIMRGIVQDHPFVDGNKRTAVVATVSFMKWNGCKFEANESELEDFVVRVATSQLEVDAIADWLDAHCKRDV